MNQESNLKTCPMCGETLHKDAKRCKNCHHAFEELSDKETLGKRKMSNEEIYRNSIEHKTKICPMCAETVKAKAKICRYCNYSFEEKVIKSQPIESETVGINRTMYLLILFVSAFISLFLTGVFKNTSIYLTIQPIVTIILKYFRIKNIGYIKFISVFVPFYTLIVKGNNIPKTKGKPVTVKKYITHTLIFYALIFIITFVVTLIKLIITHK